MLLSFQKTILDFLQQESLLNELQKLYSWRQSSAKRIYAKTQLAFWHFFYLLPLRRRGYLQQDLVLQDLLLNAFAFLPEFATPKDIESFFAADAFCFLTAQEKSALSYALCLAAPIYAELPLAAQQDFVAEDFILSFHQDQSDKDRNYYDGTLAWGLAQAFSKLGFLNIHSLEAYRCYRSYAGLDQTDYFYSDWLQILKKENFSALQLEFFLNWIQADPVLDQNFRNFLYQSHDVPLTKAWQSTEARLSSFLEDQVSKQDLIRFLYQPRISADRYDEQDETMLFQNNGHSPINDEHKRDWKAFWIGVELFQRRKDSASLMQQMSKEKLVLNDPKLVVRWFLTLLPERPQEILWAVFLDNKDQLIAHQEISKGTVNHTIAHPREVFAAAIQHRAVSLILIHNHPSGSAQPSINDRDITLRLQKTGQVVGIELQDHIILGKNQFYSFQESALHYF